MNEEKLPSAYTFDLAMFEAYMCLVSVFHTSGAIQVDDLIRKIGDTIDSRRLYKTEEGGDQIFLSQIYNSLESLRRGLPPDTGQPE
jgi:hypothetical protein